MTRNTSFHPDRQPLRHEPTLQLINEKIRGPFSFLNPTQAHYHHRPAKQQPDPTTTTTAEESDDTAERPLEAVPASDEVTASNVEFKWTSRNNRKGRHAIVIKLADAAHASYLTPPPTNSVKEVLKGIGRMFWYYPVWDVSYLVAVVFTLGSVVWVINAFFAFLPFTNPSTAFPGETLYGGGITAFIGATIFEIGSVLLMIEAVNENRTGCFGWAVEQVYHDHIQNSTAEQALTRFTPDGCTHHHKNKRNFVGKGADLAKAHVDDEKNATVSADGTPPGAQSWVWFPSWHDLRTHYLHDIGFIACSSQMFGATIFWISGFTALPGIYNHLSPISVLNGVYWVPQVVGGCGFVISGTLFMLETQKYWWLPALDVLGWHIGFWNLVGGIGFTLCPIFGFGTSYWRAYQASCSTFWGSWAFLLGSAIQWYESLDKHPVERMKE